MNLKVNLKKLLPVAMTGCILAGTLTGCSYQHEEKVNLVDENVSMFDRPPIEQQYDYQEETPYDDDTIVVDHYLEPVGQGEPDEEVEEVEYEEPHYVPAPVKNTEDNYHMGQEDFFNELGQRVNANLYLYDVSSDFCKRVRTRTYEGSGELLNYTEEYLIDGRVLYRSGYETRKVYVNQNTGDVVSYRTEDAVPDDVLNNWSYAGLEKNDVSANTIVEGSNTTIFENDNGLSVVSSVPISRDEFFHFLEYEDEFVNYYFGYRPDDYEDAITYQDPDRDYQYEYYTDLDNNGNVLSGMNRYMCDGELFYATGYNYYDEYVTDGYFSHNNSEYTR